MALSHNKMLTSLVTGPALPLLVAVVLVLLLGVSLARLTWLVLAPEPEVAPVATGSPALATRQVVTESIAEQLARLSLFGELDVIEPQAEIAASTLALDLRGVLAGSDQHPGVAIFRIGGKERVVRVNEAIQSGIVLHRVEDHRVIIERNGRLESIDLPKVSLADQIIQPSSRAVSAGPSASVRSSSIQPSSRAVRPSTSVTPASAAPTASQPALSIIQEVVQRPEKIFDYIQPQPVLRDGRLMGYRLDIRPGQRQALANFGLESGDIVIAIEGLRVDNPEAIAGIMPRLQNASRVAVTVLRNGQEVPITIQLQ